MMKKTSFFLAAALLLAGSHSLAQSLPEQFHFSDDNRRLITGGLPTAGFYALENVNTLELWFDQPNYWALLTANYAAGTDIPATLIINGDTLPSPVGVHFKGQTSYMQLPAGSQKKSFAIALDFADENQDYDGYEALNLHNAFDDPSFMREVLYDQLGRRHIPMAKANFTHLYINGQDWGLYPSVQQLNGDFIEEWFLSNNGTRWRALKTIPSGPGGPGGPGGTGGPFGTGYSSLNWLGTADTAEYKKYYTLKRAYKPEPWQDLIAVCNLLNNTPVPNREAALKPVLDIDRTLWFLATEIAFSDDDSYVHKGGMDYYLYWEPETGRLVPQEVDGNTCMKPNNANWPPFYNETDVRFALLNRLLAVPELRQRYLAHLRTIVEESMQQSLADSLVTGFFAQIDALVQSDPKKLYSYNQFLSEKEYLKTYIQQRRNFLQANAALSTPGPLISEVTSYVNGLAFAQPDAGQETLVTAKVSSASGIFSVRLYYGDGFVGNFEKTEMFDDGNHGDGAAGDGVFGANIPGFGNGAWVRYYVEALANNPVKTAAYLPKGAEHDVFIFQVNVSGFLASDVVINEIMASNQTAVADQDGQYDDWIELFNTSSAPVDLSGWHLSDDSNNLAKWTFPQGSILDAGAYLIVWADENGSQAGLHANFKLAAEGEDLFLANPDLTEGQQVVYGTQVADQGYARVPNGTGDFVIQNHTFNANNEGTTAANDAAQAAAVLQLFPNPTAGAVCVQTGNPLPQRLCVLNAWGQVLLEREVAGNATLETSAWSPGVYFVKCGERSGKLLVK